ncbi:MAG TPA: type IV pilus biogenesis protein PilP [Alphaproteobacteria bacterium]|nr:type IV pilus biogenesis protein PilP [Alphaproteobacteria bacterium]
MQNKIKNIKKSFFLFAVLTTVFSVPAMAEPQDDNSWADEMSANAISDYKVDGSVFQQITDLEQQKVLMGLEKERAQLDLELDRLAAEKIKLRMEMDTLSNNAEEQKKALAEQKAELDAQAEMLEQQKRAMTARPQTDGSQPVAKIIAQQQPDEENDVISKYKLIDIIGSGNQLQATVEDLVTGQRKKISVGKVLDGYTIKSISLDDGVVFEKDDNTETLNIGKDK